MCGEILMSLKQIGLGLLGLGLAISVGGPVSSFKGFFVMLSGYRKEKAEGRKPSQDQQAAYHSFVCYVAGGALVIAGSLIFLLDALIGE
jgi:hypothetical protein